MTDKTPSAAPAPESHPDELRIRGAIHMIEEGDLCHWNFDHDRVTLSALRLALADYTPAPAREAIARAICLACEENPDHRGDARGNDWRWQDYLGAADAAIAAGATPAPAPAVPARQAISQLFAIAADLAQLKPIARLSSLGGNRHIGHRQFGGAYMASEEALRGLAVRLRGAIDAITAATPAPAPTPAAWKHDYMGLCPDETQPESRDPQCQACRSLGAAPAPATDKESLTAALAPTVPLVQQTAPERIWLQVSDDDADADLPFDHPADVTWSRDQAINVTVPYVRADLAHDPAPALAAAGGTAPEMADVPRRQPSDDAAERYCDGHCTWLDHAPGCVRAEPADDSEIERAITSYASAVWHHDSDAMRDAYVRLRDAIRSLGMAQPKPLDDPRLQGLFSAAIDGAFTSGVQDVAPAPEGHWLAPWWQRGRACAEELASAVLAERERCAKLCEGMHDEDRPSDYAWTIRTEWAADSSVQVTHTGGDK